MKKIIAILLLLCLVSCGVNVDENHSLQLVYNDDVVMTKDGYKYTFFAHSENNSSSELISFLNSIKLSKTNVSYGNEIVRLDLEKDLIFYDNGLLQYGEEKYSIQNDIYDDYFWIIMNSAVLSIKDIINFSVHDLCRIEIESIQGIAYTVELKDQTKKDFLNRLGELGVLLEGAPERGSGGYIYRLVFEDIIIESGNGVYIYNNGKLITNKQSEWLNGSLEALLEDIITLELESIDKYEDHNLIITKIE